MQTGSFDNEVKTGTWKRFHPNGSLLDEGNYKMGKKNGEWKTYTPAGKLLKVKIHK